MVSPEQSHLQSFTMGKYTGRSKTASLLSDGFRLAGGFVVAFLVFWTMWSSFSPAPPNYSTPNIPVRTTVATPPASCNDHPGPNLRDDPLEKTFYDDPKLSYTIDSPPVKNWDEKRRDWLIQHPTFATGAANRIFMVTGSQATPCKNPIGDYLLLKLFKNKVDYCRRYGIDIFYNNVLLQPKMFSFWAKTAAVKASMLAHPEAEWIWWVDSDAAFTDMDFEIPLERYKNHNMVVHGWPQLLRERRTWTGVNAGVFLIRNSQWGLDFLDAWANMGPQSPEYGKWGKILSSIFKDKIFPESDDQSGLIYMYLKEKWGEKIFVEGSYYFEGYWLEIVDNLHNITQRYTEIEKNVGGLRRRHAEKVSEGYASLWEEQLKDAGNAKGSWRRPFITHFTGCQPCSGNHNNMYSGQSCFDAQNSKTLLGSQKSEMSDEDETASELTDEQKIEITKWFLLNSPAGEIQYVAKDIKAVLQDERIYRTAAEDAFPLYNKSHMICLEFPDRSGEVMVTPFSEIDKNEYLDPRTAQVAIVDHVKQVCEKSRPANDEELPSPYIEEYRFAMDAEIMKYVSEVYPKGTCSVYCVNGKDVEEPGMDFELVVVISAARLSPQNFCNGSWRSVWHLEFKEELQVVEVSGELEVGAHYFEEGNVQLEAQHVCKDTTMLMSPEDCAHSVTTIIRHHETEYLNSLQASYSNLPDATFKDLRRKLPVTRTLFPWHSTMQLSLNKDIHKSLGLK